MPEPVALPSADETRSYFYLRRLHSLFGLIPIGAFICFHLVFNATILAGPTEYQNAVDGIHTFEKVGLLLTVELLFIFLPIAFHAVLGIVIILSGKWNTAQYRYGGNIRYTLERVTGLIVLAFIVLHVWQMHRWGKPFGGGFFDPEHAATSAATAIQQNIVFWGIVYIVGIAATVYHLGNGLWTALITWGITIGPRAQRLSGYVCTALAIVFGVIGMGALFGVSSYHASAKTPEHEQQVAQVAQLPQSAALPGIDVSH